ncbi:MAG TPA: PLP-dependent aminotransferase family protein [Spirochaetota bacterium]|nr:PLP-dependent aminotransferase family protein [Spirochaetota bacterium]
MIDYYKPIYSASSLNMKSSVIRDMFRLTSDPEMISFAGGLPGAEAFPVNELQEIINKAILRNGSSVFQYGTTEGYSPLRESISQLMDNVYGLSTNPENVLVTSGSQQALYLLCKILVNPGDVVITENPTYVGALSTFRSFMADIHAVDMNEQGMDTPALEQRIGELVRSGKKPRLIYTIPSIHNPTGLTMGIIQRHMLYDLASKYDLLIVEDDPYGMIRYDGLKIPPVKKLDIEGRVVYLGSFSKTVSPGLRTGWIAGQKDIIRRCVIAKQGEDTCSGTLSQFIINDFITDGSIYSQIERVKKIYSKKRDLMKDCIDKMIPSASYTLPQGGLFLWVTLGGITDTSLLLKKSLDKKVAFVPGEAFYPGYGGQSSLRLNFSYPDCNEIEAGIKRIAVVINEANDH